VGLTADGHGVDLASGDPFGFCGGAVLLRTSVLGQVGGVPARFFCYYEDTDTAWRLRLADHTIVSVPAAEVTHRHGASTRPGSRQFHLWNERNRLAMLIRCAPAGVAARETARFAAITAMLPIRQTLAGRNCRWPRVALKPGDPPAHERTFRPGSAGEAGTSGRSRPRNRRWPLIAWVRGPEARPAAVPWNFRVGLRLQVMRELGLMLPSLLKERRTVTRLANVPRSVVWRWARSANSAS
jgi:hypothetical protein